MGDRIANLEAEVARLREAILRLTKTYDPNPHWRREDVLRILGIPFEPRDQQIARMSLAEVEDRFGLRDGLGRVVGRDVEGTM